MVIFKPLEKSLIASPGLAHVHDTKCVIVQDVNSPLFSEIYRTLAFCTGEVTFQGTFAFPLSPLNAISFPK